MKQPDSMQPKAMQPTRFSRRDWMRYSIGYVGMGMLAKLGPLQSRAFASTAASSREAPARRDTQ